MLYLHIILILIITKLYKVKTETCSNENNCSAENTHEKYKREINEWTSKVTNTINNAQRHFKPCKRENCSCHMEVMNQDLHPFKDGITMNMFELGCTKGTKYQVIDGELYRDKDCHFPARCSGVEHYLKDLAPRLPNMEFIINTRDWPQVNHAWGHAKAPVFSFSKTKDYYDIMYPAWSFWEGGPAIALYPTGIGRWDKHRLSISAAADRWQWDKKEAKAFFRGSRTSEERDALILLSRSNPSLVDAQYTKNQAWKTDTDTLHAPPASEVSFEDHCKYKYLFNYRGVAASFRLKHLFLCKSLVFHVGNDWLEFFYPSLKPWVHYVPIKPDETKEEIAKYIEYFKNNDELAKEITERGFQHIWENLTNNDVKCYWRRLLKRYAKLVKYEVTLDKNLIRI